MNIKILKADLNDKIQQEAIILLLNEYAKDLLGYKKELSENTKNNLINGLKNFPTTLVFLALADNKFIGLTISFMGFSTFLAKQLINIHDIFVLENYRGLKVGTKLIDEIEKHAKLLNCCKITLEVQETNINAINLYKKMGFMQSTLDVAAGRQFFYTKLI